MEIGSVLAFGVGIVVLLLLCKLFAAPLKFILKLIGNAILGAIVLIAINLIGGDFLSFTIAVTPLNALIAGVLGAPGVILLIILNVIYA